jgi:ABC-type Fe3+ transport system permease subunit
MSEKPAGTATSSGPGSRLATSAAPEGSPPTGPAPGASPVPGRRGGPLGRWWWAVGLAIAALVVIALAPLASPDPDGLERVAEDQGFIDQARNVIDGLMSDYAIPGIDDPAVSTILAGLVGVVIVVIVIVVLGRVLARRRPEGHDPGA